MALRLLGLKVGIKPFKAWNMQKLFSTNVPTKKSYEPENVVARAESYGRVIIDTGDELITDKSPVRPKWTLDGRDPIDMIAAVPPIEIEGRVAVCDGGHPALGHPRVFVNVDKGVNTCGYCGLRYVQKEGHHGGHH